MLEPISAYGGPKRPRFSHTIIFAHTDFFQRNGPTHISINWYQLTPSTDGFTPCGDHSLNVLLHSLLSLLLSFAPCIAIHQLQTACIGHALTSHRTYRFFFAAPINCSPP